MIRLSDLSTPIQVSSPARPIVCVCQEVDESLMRVDVFFLDVAGQVQSARVTVSARSLELARFDLLTKTCKEAVLACGR